MTFTHPRTSGIKAFAAFALIGLQAVWATQAQAVTVDFKVRSTSSTTYTTDVFITNDGAAVSSWTLSFKLGNTIKSSFSSVQSGSDPYTFKNVSSNGSIATGASAKFGFTANGTLNSGALANCSFNGAACTFLVNGVKIGGASSSVSSASSVSSTSTASSASSASSTASSTTSTASGTVTGTVIDSAGRPIANALVYKQAQPSVFAKTDASGKYALAAKAGDALYVSAYRFEDKQTTAGGSTTNFTLSNDATLSSAVVYHNNFNYLRPGDGYTKKEALADFNTYKVGGMVVDSTTPGRMAIDPNVSYDNKGSSIRVLYPKGKVTPSDSGVQIDIPLSNDPKVNNFAADELYLSYWFKFSDNFEFTCGGKMPGLEGSQAGDDNTLGWTGRWMFRNGGSIQSYMHYSVKGDEPTFLGWGDEIAPRGSSGCPDETRTSYLKKGQWHHMQLHYKLNTPGKKDGIMEGWLDGDAAHYLNNSIGDFRQLGLSDGVTINAIFFSTFHGGSKPEYAPSKDVYAWFDEFTVSKTKIPYVRPSVQR